ncbi:Starch-binding associating with outer membrane [Pedobacter steynii]|uniref:Starch-binding associating with outer membrane n=1 Tax=Pedobacter steynii TaxID=430522 RepID=A0A1H0GNS6_9SPHI|nr:SusD/RagB family nutrient-binding outer membrane lipoprotein [Pedobacter steynii]NQX42477.1 SusD/RagB family nutrient-binding outer membrane lipoprotein [Pedobacter steynii]SDO08544.1 Starch-binding associating with outer membrane [Pedobacter steynii]
MKINYKAWIGLVGLLCISISSCKKEKFVELNTNPQLLDKITPEQQFMNAIVRMQDRSEWYYDNVRGIMPWMQMATGLNGNGASFVSESGSMRNVRFGIFYPGVGASLSDVEYIISKLSAEEQETRVHQLAITNIVKAYYAFYVSDINGSVPYTEAFQGKYGGTFTPKYNKQEELFNLLDEVLKTSVAKLTATPAVPQASFDTNDLFFKGDVSKWVKTANAVRLRMAMRLMKRDAAKMTARVQEALASSGQQMAGNADSWVFETAANFAPGGDWSVQNIRAPKGVVDFMYNNSDPRMKYFYQPNYFTRENFDAAKAQGKIPANAVYDNRRYYGVPVSPDVSSAPDFAKFFNSVQIESLIKGVKTPVTLDTLSNLQRRLFAAGEEGGKGINFFPLITYAEVCFMRAELAARNVIADDAKMWYERGITASIQMYDDMASRALITDRQEKNSYVPTKQEEITTYLTQPGVLFDPAKGVDMIASQAYLHFFKQPAEAWALYKRTGLPNHTSTLPLEKIIALGTEQQIPRRAALPLPGPGNLNYKNIINAYDDMKTDPDFGQGPTDMFGRVWWDKK